MTNTAGIPGDRICSFIERVEHIDEEIKALNEGKKEVFAEAKGEGFDVKVLKEISRLRKQVSTPEQDCIVFRSKDASMMPTRMPSSPGLSGGRQVGVRSPLGVSALLRRERRLL
jgi:uncharacterized protein (UPF0335 family)